MPTDGIQRRSFFRGDSYEHPDGEWVRFSDVEARLEAADRLADAVDALPDCGCAPDQSDALDRALAAYRSPGEEAK